MAYCVYTYASQFVDAGQVGLYIGTREENLGECMEIVTELATWQAATSPRRARPGEENLKGRLLLSLESTSTRMTRLGKALVTGVEIVSVEETIGGSRPSAEASSPTLAGELFAPDGSRRQASAASEERFRKAVARVNPALAEAA